MMFRSFHQIAAALVTAALFGLPPTSAALAAKAKPPAEAGKLIQKKENALTAPIWAIPSRRSRYAIA